MSFLLILITLKEECNVANERRAFAFYFPRGGFCFSVAAKGNKIHNQMFDHAPRGRKIGEKCQKYTNNK